MTRTRHSAIETFDAGARFAGPTGIGLDSKGRTLFVVNSELGIVVKLTLSGKP
jgi:hypothetical protein